MLNRDVASLGDRGHKTDTSETTRATSRDASRPPPTARFAGESVSPVTARVPRGVQKLGSCSESQSACRSVASRLPDSGGGAWGGRSSIWDCAGCFSWWCCCAGRSVRRNSRSFCCGTSSRSCAGSRGRRGLGRWIGQFWRRWPGRCRAALGPACRYACDGVALAPAAGQAPLDLPAPAAGAAAARSSGGAARCPACTREPRLGLQADRRRAA
jgi:hypothetical protein